MEEQEYLAKVQNELDEAKIKKQYNKLRAINEQLEDYTEHMLRKKVHYLLIKRKNENMI